MAKTQVSYSALLLPLFAGIVVRQALGGPPIFRSEFLIEDLILLLILVGGIAPSRFKPLILYVISCSIGITMALFPLPRVSVGMVVFALLAILSAVRALIELSKLRKCGPSNAVLKEADAPKRA
jgi:hypothetical protein